MQATLWSYNFSRDGPYTASENSLWWPRWGVAYEGHPG